jgi:hypothetical protein
MRVVLAEDSVLLREGLVWMLGSAGEVAVADPEGALRARAGSGKVTGTGLRSTVADVEAGRGDVVLGFQRAPEDVRAVAGEGGDVEVTVPDGDGYRVGARAGRSVVEVRRDQAASRRITALAPRASCGSSRTGRSRRR